MKRELHYDQKYETFLVVKNLGSYSAASRKLSLTPSAVAYQIHAIEEELELKLFEKNANRLVITREGKLVADYIEKIKVLCTKMGDDLSADTMWETTVCIGTTISAETAFLSGVMAKYQEKHPTTQVKVLTHTLEELHDLLQNGMIDLAVVDGEIKSGDFSSVLLDTDYLVAIVPNESEYATKKFITLKDLKKEKLILRSTGSGTRNLLEAALTCKGESIDRFHVMIETDSVDTIKNLVRSNYGISILSNRACEKDAINGKFVTLPILDLNISRNILIYYRKENKPLDIISEIQNLYMESER